MGRVLVVDDDRPVREALGQTLELADHLTVLAGSFLEAKDHITADFPGVILSDIRMPGRDGFFLLDYAQRTDPELPVILLTGEGDIPMAVRAMGQGAFGFLEKPCAAADLAQVLDRALKTRALVIENRRLKSRLVTGDPAARLIFGRSALAEALRDRVRGVATSRAEVLITGPPGSGVSKVAEVIHLGSARAKGAFLKRSADGLTRAGLARALAASRDGTLFLDEMQRLAGDTQLALLDHLEAAQGARILGGSSASAETARNCLNADLYYRMEAVTVRIPALSERPEDIPVLFRHYVEQAAEQAGLAVPDTPPDLLAGLLARDWPGNARALMSEAMRLVLGFADFTEPGEAPGLTDRMAQVERAFLVQALQRHGGRAAAAAEALKLPRKTFYDKLARYGLKPEQFRD